ncbi:MAG: hypothetical protein WCA00_17490, partial [Candidatus Acidiferrales bacterium]
AVQARRKACVLVEHRNSTDPAVRRRDVLAALPVNVLADLLHVSRNAPVVAAVQAGAIIKLRLAGSDPVQEYRKLNRASRSMHANQRRAAVRSSRNDMRKASASCIRCVREQA